MVTTGFSKPYVAKYGTSPGAASNTYTNGMALGRGVNVTVEVDAGDDNNFYADNIIAETAAAQFTTATGTVTVDGLDNDAATLILGLPAPKSFEVATSKSVQLQGYGGVMDPPYVGFAYIRRTMMNGVTSFYPVIHPKVRFAIPSDSAATQEDTIDWQTQELAATILRDDTTASNWKIITEEGCETEADAEAVIKKYFNIVDTMSLQNSAPASTQGEDE